MSKNFPIICFLATFLGGVPAFAFSTISASPVGRTPASANVISGAYSTSVADRGCDLEISAGFPNVLYVRVLDQKQGNWSRDCERRAFKAWVLTGDRYLLSDAPDENTFMVPTRRGAILVHSILGWREYRLAR